MHLQVSAYVPSPEPGPGRLTTVPLEFLSRDRAELVLPEATVRDERGLDLFESDDRVELLADPAGGGPPGGSEDKRRSAARFGVTNVAYHTQRALRAAAALLDAPLPHLLVRIGVHDDGHRRWGGGHYRVAARQYDPPEDRPVSATGEVHLGGGRRFLPTQGDGLYFAAPAHNVAIIYHEIGHHVCRHTADFRLNAVRAVGEQTNKKIALDEGTCDVFTAIMLDSADIYGWHRSSLSLLDRRRRALSPAWTMAGFEGGSADPHCDGTIWASACWTARGRVIAAGHQDRRFDRMLLRGLRSLDAQPQLGHRGHNVDRERLKGRRYFGNLLEAMLRADPDLADPVLAGMAAHGIRPGWSNTELRDAARRELLSVAPSRVDVP